MVEKVKCRMQCTQNKIVLILLYAPPRFHVGALLHFDYRVKQLKLGHMFNIINVKAPAYLRTNVEMVHHIYHTNASNLAGVIPRVKGSGQTSFFYTSICQWNNLPNEIKQCQFKTSFRKDLTTLLCSR